MVIKKEIIKKRTRKQRRFVEKKIEGEGFSREMEWEMLGALTGK